MAAEPGLPISAETSDAAPPAIASVAIETAGAKKTP